MFSTSSVKFDAYFYACLSSLYHLVIYSAGKLYILITLTAAVIHRRTDTGRVVFLDNIAGTLRSSDRKDTCSVCCGQLFTKHIHWTGLPQHISNTSHKAKYQASTPCQSPQCPLKTSHGSSYPIVFISIPAVLSSKVSDRVQLQYVLSEYICMFDFFNKVIYWF